MFRWKGHIPPATSKKWKRHVFLQNEEGYICIYSKRDFDAILFTHEGGVDIGNVEDKAKMLKIMVDKDDTLDKETIINELLGSLDPAKQE